MEVRGGFVGLLAVAVVLAPVQVVVVGCVEVVGDDGVEIHLVGGGTLFVPAELGDVESDCVGDVILAQESIHLVVIHDVNRIVQLLGIDVAHQFVEVVFRHLTLVV